ncbi:MAG TPA: hypothetical protein DGL25_02080 [Dehalococcoidia bacterium]|nr:hypothetical protein [Dehalococcoidia bacterium]
MIIVLHGQDELRLRRRLEGIRAAGDGVEAADVVLLDGRVVKPEEILGPSLTAPFLSSQRIVIVEGLLGRFDGGGGKGGTRGARIDSFNSLFEALAVGIPETTTLVFVEANLNAGRNPFLRRLDEIGGLEVEHFPELKRGELVKFVREEAQLQGVNFQRGRSVRVLPEEEEWRRPREDDPAQLLAALHPNTLELAQELEKLALYTMGRQATVDDIDLLCGGEREATIWEFVDGVLDGDMTKALQAMRFLLSRGESVNSLLGQLGAAYRPLVTVLNLMEDGESPEGIGKAIRRPWPRLRDAAIRRAQGLGQEGVKGAYEVLVVADRSIKLGEVRDEFALEVAVTRLVAFASGEGHRRAS